MFEILKTIRDGWNNVYFMKKNTLEYKYDTKLVMFAMH